MSTASPNRCPTTQSSLARLLCTQRRWGPGARFGRVATLDIAHLSTLQFVSNDAFDLAGKLQQYRQVKSFSVTYIREGQAA